MKFAELKEISYLDYRKITQYKRASQYDKIYKFMKNKFNEKYNNFKSNNIYKTIF